MDARPSGATTNNPKAPLSILTCRPDPRPGCDTDVCHRPQRVSPSRQRAPTSGGPAPSDPLVRQVARPRRASCPRPGQRPGGFLCPTPSCPPLLAVRSTAVSGKSLPLAGLSRLLSGVGEALGAPRGPSQLEWGRHSGRPEVPLSSRIS